MLMICPVSWLPSGSHKNGSYTTVLSYWCRSSAPSRRALLRVLVPCPQQDRHCSPAHQLLSTDQEGTVWPSRLLRIFLTSKQGRELQHWIQSELFWNSSSRSFLRPVIMSLCPFSANFSAIALPKPDVAPVTRMILFMVYVFQSNLLSEWMHDIQQSNIINIKNQTTREECSFHGRSRLSQWQARNLKFLQSA